MAYSAYFFTTVEFYVILAVVAAAIVALAARPDSVAPVKEILLACTIEEDNVNVEPMVSMKCLDNGQIVITRTGVTNICADGAVSLAIKVKGSDISIEERLTPGRGLLLPSVHVKASLPFIRLDRYHVIYNSSYTGLYAAFTFPAKPGACVVRPLRT